MRSVFSEAWRNLVSGTSKTVTAVVVSLLVFGGLAVIDTRAMIAVFQQVQTFRESGATVQVLSAAGAIDGARCEALNQVQGIRASGALRGAKSTHINVLPANEFMTYEVTPGFAAVLSEQAGKGSGVWLPDTLAHTLSVGEGSTLVTAQGTTQVAGSYAYPDDGRDRQLGNSVLAQVPADGVFDACWAEVWPPSVETANYLRTALLPIVDKDNKPNQGQLNYSLGKNFDAVGALSERVTALSAYVTCAIGIVLGFVLIRTRRLELSAALHAQVPRVMMSWQVLIETSIIAIMTLVPAFSLLVFVSIYDNPLTMWEPWLVGARIVVSGVVGLLGGTQLGVLFTREKHLFKYFKER